MAAPMDAAPVDARPQTIDIGTAARMRKGAAHVWQYDLTLVGSEHIYVCRNPPSTTFRNDIMFIVEEEDVDGHKWCVVYEGREVDGQLEERSGVFRTSSAFWEVGDHEWETNEVRSRASYAVDDATPEWRNSGWKVCTSHTL